MQAAFGILELQPGASLVEIKKAYARLLKRTRPDDDAAGFQRLQEAYEACVDFAKRPQVQPEPARSRIMQVALPPPLPLQPLGSGATPPVRTRAPVLPAPQLRELLEEIVAQSECQSAAWLRQWLHTHETLVSLDVQRLVASGLPAFIIETKPRLDTEKLRVLFEYFIGAEYNPAHADPRLRIAWEQVHEDELFQRELASLRRRHHTAVDRLLFEELLGAPKPSRRRRLLALPTMVGRIASLLDSIRAISPERAGQVLQAEAAEFWRALAAPGKLPWRLIALVHAQLAVGISILVSGIGLLVGMEPLAIAGMSLAGVLEASVVWFVLKGIGILRYRIAMRQAKSLAAGYKRRDSLLTANYVLCGAAGAGSLVQVFSSADGTGLAVAGVCAALVALILVLSGRSGRWEMVLLASLGVGAVWRILSIVPGVEMPGPAIIAISLSFGSLLAVVADEWHAKHEKLEPRRARTEINHIALKLSAASFAVLFLALNLGDAQEDTQTREASEQGQENKASPAQLDAEQARMEKMFEKMGLEANPWAQWARDKGVTELPTFRDVDGAFQTLRQAVTPNETPDTPYRAFHVPDGPLAGDWIFSGGDRSKPDLMVHYLLADASGKRNVGQILCRRRNSECRAFQRQAATVPEDLSQEDRQLPGGRLTWDSPGLPAERYECPATGLPPYGPSLQQSVPVRVLFNGEGTVVDVELDGTSNDVRIDSAALSAARRCWIIASSSEPGVLETAIRIALR